jgi:hypothetical protein
MITGSEFGNEPMFLFFYRPKVHGFQSEWNWASEREFITVICAGSKWQIVSLNRAGI